MSRTTEPTTIVKGERIEWTKSYSGFSAEDYDLEYRFRGPGGGVNVAATADGSSFLADLTADLSDDFTATGKHRWQAWLTETADPTNTFVIDEGSVEVRAGFDSSSLAALDLRTPAKIMLDTIDEALLAFATSDVMEYEITTPAGSRRVKRSDKANLTEQRQYWAMIVRRENAAEAMRNGDKWGTTITVRMP